MFSKLTNLICLIKLIQVEPSAGCSQVLPSAPHPGRHKKFNLIVEDPNLGPVFSEYALHLPALYDTSNSVPVPLVLDNLGWTGTAHDQTVNMLGRDVADLD